VHCVMHTFIVVKLGGNEKHKKLFKQHVHFMNSGGIFEKVGRNNNLN